MMPPQFRDYFFLATFAYYKAGSTCNAYVVRLLICSVGAACLNATPTPKASPSKAWFEN